MPNTYETYIGCQLSAITAHATPIEGDAAKDMGQYEYPSNKSSLKEALRQTHTIQTHSCASWLRIYRVAAANILLHWALYRGELYKAPARTTGTLTHHQRKPRVR